MPFVPFGNFALRTVVTMKANYLFSALASLLLALSFWLVGCTIPRFGIGGQYQEGESQFLKGRGGNMDSAITALESVVTRDPTYKDSLTLLGRAYFAKGRYQDALQILQRALAVNPEDEAAWLVLGLAQLRLGQNEKGLETVKSGITLISKVSVNGYHGFIAWDFRGTIRSAVRRTVFLATKGLDEKEDLIRSAETVLRLIDDEEHYQRYITTQQRRDDY